MRMRNHKDLQFLTVPFMTPIGHFPSLLPRPAVQVQELDPVVQILGGDIHNSRRRNQLTNRPKSPFGTALRGREGPARDGAARDPLLRVGGGQGGGNAEDEDDDEEEDQGEDKADGEEGRGRREKVTDPGPAAGRGGGWLSEGLHLGGGGGREEPAATPAATPAAGEEIHRRSFRKKAKRSPKPDEFSFYWYFFFISFRGNFIAPPKTIIQG